MGKGLKESMMSVYPATAMSQRIVLRAEKSSNRNVSYIYQKKVNTKKNSITD